MFIYLLLENYLQGLYRVLVAYRVDRMTLSHNLASDSRFQCIEIGRICVLICLEQPELFFFRQNNITGLDAGW